MVGVEVALQVLRQVAKRAERTGHHHEPPAVTQLVATLREGGLSIGGDQLKTRPRGVAGDHPRLELLRHRSLTAVRDWPAGPLLHDRQALSLVRQTWVQLIPLCDWLCEHVGPPRL
jgi:hypothetical protein